jgi:hypothetical protein
MLNIDIDACLAQEVEIDDNKPRELEIVLENEKLFPDGAPSFVLSIAREELKRLFLRTSRKASKKKNDATVNLRFVEALLPNFRGWSGFSTPFDKTKVVPFLTKYENVCNTFCLALIDIFQTWDAQYLKYTEDAEKN